MRRPRDIAVSPRTHTAEDVTLLSSAVNEMSGPQPGKTDEEKIEETFALLGAANGGIWSTSGSILDYLAPPSQTQFSTQYNSLLTTQAYVDPAPAESPGRDSSPAPSEPSSPAKKQRQVRRLIFVRPTSGLSRCFPIQLERKAMKKRKSGATYVAWVSVSFTN